MKPAIIQFEAIGTAWTIELFDDALVESLPAVQNEIEARIREYDTHYSRFRADSLIAQISRVAGDYTLPEDAKPLFDVYEQMYAVTDGAVTPLIGQSLSAAGYGADYSLRAGSAVPAQSWESVMAYAYPNLHIKQPVLLDLGAAGKGYLVDLIGELLASMGFITYCINAGGDMLYRGNDQATLAVALENPNDSGEAVGIAQLSSGSLCGSSPNRRAWGNHSDGTFRHHIIDPTTGMPTDGLKAVWVYAETALLADALTTALFFVSPERLLLTWEFDYALITTDNSLRYSTGFPAEFFTLEQQYKEILTK